MNKATSSEIFIGPDYRAKLTDNNAVLNPREVIAVTVLSPRRLSFFRRHHKEQPAVQLQHFNVRSSLAQAGVFCMNSLSEIGEGRENNVVHLMNVSPFSRLILPSTFPFARPYQLRAFIQGAELIDKAKGINKNGSIKLFDTENTKYAVEEVLDWGSQDERVQRLLGISIPLRRIGVATASEIRIRNLTSDREQLDRQLKIKWEYSGNLDVPYMLLGETVPVQFPEDTVGQISSGLENDIFHGTSNIIDRGFGKTKYKESNEGTSIRTEFIFLRPNTPHPTDLKLFLFA